MNLKRVIATSLIALAAAPAAASAKDFPPPPKLPKGVELERVKTQRGPFSANLPVTELSEHRPVESEMFRTRGSYAGSKDVLAQWVNYVYADNIPALGGTYRAPTYYGEVPDGTATGCSGGPLRRNAMYCSTNNAIMFTRSYLRPAYNRYGDGAFAGVLAHEWGHGAQYWLGYGNRGQFQWTIYSEGFADCMSGGFMARMFNDGNLDAGDLQELLRWRGRMGITSNDPHTHGSDRWRQDAVMYGYNNGMRGCAQWGYQLYSGRG